MALATAGGGVGEFCGGKFGLPPRAEVPNTIPAAVMIEANIQRMVSVLILSSLRYITYYESQPKNMGRRRVKDLWRKERDRLGFSCYVALQKESKVSGETKSGETNGKKYQKDREYSA
jgi:hypothetical protein